MPSARLRNLADEQMAVIRESDGMVGLNFEVSAIRPDGYDEADTPLEVWPERQGWMRC